MNGQSTEQAQAKRVKNIAAIVYLLAMAFLVGGSYWHQQHKPEAQSQETR
jgi:hypothetical protein